MNLLQTFKKKLFKINALGFCLMLFVIAPVNFISLYADPSLRSSRQSEDPLELGIRLETEFWTAVQNQNIKKFSNKLSSIFQGLNISGIYTRAQQINGLTGATLSGFAFNSPIATRFRDVLVFSYHFVAFQSNLTNGPSITIWKKHHNTWKIVSHSYVPFK